MISTIQENVPLAELTTFKIGGKARFFVRAKSETEIIEALEFAEQNSLDIFILGGGSNILIADEGFDGLVLQIALKGISTFAEKDGTIYVTANAGEDWDEFVKICVEKNLAGIECLSGIPGFVGGTPVQNVGAYGQEVSETIVSVRCFDRRAKEIKELTNAECGFAYRTSVFNTTRKNHYIVLAVTYALELNGEPKIVYADLKNYFGDGKPTLAETRNAVIEIRSTKSMVINENEGNSRGAGSFFKNPIVTRKKFAKMCESFGGEIPSFRVDENLLKMPAAWLIEQSGFHKGFQFGRVGLSTKHTLAIVNSGAATAQDVLALKDKIQAKVQENFDVELKPEPIFVGF